MNPSIKKNEIILYLIFGILTTIVNIISYLFITDILNIHYLISNIIAWFLSVLFAYITNRIWVFKSKNENILKEFGLFISGRIFSGVLDTTLMYLFIGIFFWNDLISKIIINIIVVIVNYVISKLIVFD
ncbi:MAG: GtrA family protein [Methanobacteriaceae archaeon]|nr:GtrA family protein [Methanobacteriaceae archaeon]